MLRLADSFAISLIRPLERLSLVLTADSCAQFSHSLGAAPFARSCSTADASSIGSASMYLVTGPFDSAMVVETRR